MGKGTWLGNYLEDHVCWLTDSLPHFELLKFAFHVHTIESK